jgi:TrmH family RNA methyltransferase
MLTKAQNKYIRSLTQQKYRKEHHVFIAEGDKIVREWLLSAYSIQMIVALPDWAEQNDDLIQRHKEASVHIVKEAELESISALQTPNKALLVVNMPEEKSIEPVNEWCIALDNIRDPGNMGTIIRIADWFGIKNIFVSFECVDVYSPKVVQGAMGSHIRVQVHIRDIEKIISETKLPVLVATLDGEDIYELPKLSSGVLVIGNESKGVSPSIVEKATHKITIPRRGGAESLNAAVSTGIICALLMK